MCLKKERMVRVVVVRGHWNYQFILCLCLQLLRLLVLETSISFLFFAFEAYANFVFIPVCSSQWCFVYFLQCSLSTWTAEQPQNYMVFTAVRTSNYNKATLFSPDHKSQDPSHLNITKGRKTDEWILFFLSIGLHNYVLWQFVTFKMILRISELHLLYELHFDDDESFIMIFLLDRFPLLREDD